MSSSKNTRECDDEYSGIIAQITPRTRVVICRDRIQFIVQVRNGATWRARRFFVGRAALLAQIGEIVPNVPPETMDSLGLLPPLARNYPAHRATSEAGAQPCATEVP